MFFFRKKRVKRAPTPFEEYLNSITPPKLVSLVCAQKREIKCPAMFHYAVLINARSFVRQIEVSDLEFKDPLNQALNLEDSARLNSDDVAIQVIAFLYYWAMADFLKNENLDEYGGHQTQRTGGGEYYSSLKVALTFTDDLTVPSHLIGATLVPSNRGHSVG